MKQNNKIKRNIIIYIVGVYLLSIIGGILQSKGNGAGGLLFIIGPILMMVLLRTFAGDGWRDAGLKIRYLAMR